MGELLANMSAALIGPILTHANWLEVNSEVVPAPYSAKTYLLMLSGCPFDSPVGGTTLGTDDHLREAPKAE